MTVPEAAVHEKRDPVFGKHEIRRSRQVAAMKAEAIAESVGDPAHDELGIGVALAHAPHQRRPSLGADDVHAYLTSARAFSATCSGVMLKWRKSASAGAEAPKLVIPTTASAQRSQPKGEAASTATRGAVPSTAAR